MPAANPIDILARNLAEWVLAESKQIADSIKGGINAPGAANLSEQQKLEYFSRQFFNPDGSPNHEGRAKEMARLGPVAFAETYQEVLRAHPEFKQAAAPETEPTEVPGVREVTKPPTTRPTEIPGVREIIGPSLAPEQMPSGPLPPPTPVAMAGGGIVTEPTLALIGEAGPEMVVPLQGEPGPGAQLAAPSVPQPDVASPASGAIEAYIRQAAQARGIDPDVAVKVALYEGGRDPRKPNQAPFTDPAVRGTFATGSSWWPFQLHYGGKGYEQYGTTAGMGNDFTAATGYQPGDPRAWQAATDYALDQAVKIGWRGGGNGGWYGAKAAGIGDRQGLPPQRRAA